jgi:CRISPR-associated exonuclease Cas4
MELISLHYFIKRQVSNIMSETFPPSFNITGTYVWYYCICKREVWLLSHGITSDQDNIYMDIGRFLHKTSYERDRKEIDFHGMKFDILQNRDGRLVVGEIKKSSRYMESARMQLLLYLSKLEEEGIQAEGLLLVPAEKKRERVILDTEAKERLGEIKKGILDIVQSEKPPPPVKSKYCRKCAYSEMCWA